MKNISAEVFIFCLWTKWIHLVTYSKIESRELHCYSRCALDKIFEIYTFDRCAQGWSGQKSFLACGDAKKRIGEQLNYFWNMCPKSFSWAKNKRELFSDGKLRGPLLVALKYHTYLALVSSLVVNAKVSSTQSRTFFSERSWWKIDVALSFLLFFFLYRSNRTSRPTKRTSRSSRHTESKDCKSWPWKETRRDRGRY